MSARNKGPKRLSPTTIILVLVLLGAVAGAARLVTPPPPGPPVVVPPAPVSVTVKQTQVEKMKADEMARTKAMMQAPNGGIDTSVPHVEDPSAAIIDNSYWTKTKPGDEGLKQVDEQVKRRKAAYEEYRRKVSALQKSKDAVPQSAPASKQALQQTLQGGPVPTK